MQRIVCWVSFPPRTFQESTLSTNESVLVDLLRERTGQRLTTSDVLSVSPLGDAETLKTLASLIGAGVVELRDPDESLGPGWNEEGATSPVPLDVPSHGGAFPAKLARFEVERVLGRGSMGAVLFARDPAIGRVVAIKLIQSAAHLTPLQRERYHERFYREASAAGRLHHPGITAVYDVGHMEDGTPFIVMEYVRGRTLREVLHSEELGIEQTLQIARDVLDALSYAHSQGIVHRDIKPSNIIITPDFHAKIMDFGIAHVLGSELTSEDDILGSPSYMAPEQLSKGAIDQRTDLFSLAVVLYRILTGKLPFMGDSFAAIAQSVLSEDPAPPHVVAPAVPLGLSRVVARCMAKDPAQRYPSANAVQQALTTFEIVGDLEDGAEPSGAAPSRNRWLAVSLALLIGAVLVFRLTMTVHAPVPPDETRPAPAVAGGAEIEGPQPEAPFPALDPSPSPSPPAPSKPIAVAPAEASTRTTVPRRPPVPPPEVIPQPERPTPAPAPEISPEPPARATGDPRLADLFYKARLALDRGDIVESRTLLEQLLSRDPTFAGAADLHRLVTDQIWERTLPLIARARHNHRLGGCIGELSLTALGVRFVSSEHSWA
ncbi:MAG TPA: protein kinase, partial [Vicinamibacteria bacterium]|nr:protein kinase [Vicinamibacteria bacterium]